MKAKEVHIGATVRVGERHDAAGRYLLSGGSHAEELAFVRTRCPSQYPDQTRR